MSSPFLAKQELRNMEGLLWDINDVARALRVSPHTVRRWSRKDAKLRRIKLGSRVLFDPRDVAEFVERARTEAKSPAPSEESEPRSD